ncbi:MAG: hypothetical protein WCZ23_07035 [Rhodospirillaceae bacterium]
MTQTAAPTPISLLDHVRAIAPEPSWNLPLYTDRDEVSAHGLPNRRWVMVKRKASDSYEVTVYRSIRETPDSASPRPQSLTAGRRRSGPDLAAMVAEALADPLDAVTVAGLVLWPDTLSFIEGYTDDSGRYSFSRQSNGWEWRVNSKAVEAAMGLLGRLSFYGFGNTAPTLPEAVADAVDAPRRFAAMVEILAVELAQAAPNPDPWTYAAVIAAQDGERAFVGPCAALLDLKDQLRAAEAPFIGRMDTDASYIVAVPVDQAEGLDAAGLIDHPAAVRLKRY